MRLIEILESKIDNVKGAGVTPNNQEIDYMGKRVSVTPKMFLRLAKRLELYPDTKERIAALIKFIQEGGTVASPFLTIKIPEEWEEGNFDIPTLPKVMNHEGRHRMYALLEIDGNIPVETHLFFSGGLRARHITPEILAKLNEGILNEYGNFVPGPWFS